MGTTSTCTYLKPELVTLPSAFSTPRLPSLQPDQNVLSISLSELPFIVSSRPLSPAASRKALQAQRYRCISRKSFGNGSFLCLMSLGTRKKGLARAGRLSLALDILTYFCRFLLYWSYWSIMAAREGLFAFLVWRLGHDLQHLGAFAASHQQHLSWVGRGKPCKATKRSDYQTSYGTSDSLPPQIRHSHSQGAIWEACCGAMRLNMVAASSQLRCSKVCSLASRAAATCTQTLSKAEACFIVFESGGHRPPPHRHSCCPRVWNSMILRKCAYGLSPGMHSSVSGMIWSATGQLCCSCSSCLREKMKRQTLQTGVD